jgi:arabinose-5-phosphate isomerase
MSGDRDLSSHQKAREVLEIEAAAIKALAERVDERFDRAIELLASTRGRVVVSGMGKSGIVCKKIAATLSSTGTASYFLHPAEALHGDLGMVVEGDLVLVVSASGETVELLRLLEFVRLKRLGVTIVALVGDLRSSLARHADVALDVSVAREACPLNLAPTASTTAAMALGDALALALSARRGFKPEDFARNHPGGSLGKQLIRVGDVMHTGESLPRVLPGVTVQEAAREMSAKKLGMTAVVDESGRLLGLFTDGDLRRTVERGLDLAKTAVGDCASPRPVLIGRADPVAKTLKLMEEYQITSLLVADDEGILEGVVHIHDLWRLEMF